MTRKCMPAAVLCLCTAARAQVQMNPPDTASPTLGNYTVQSEVSHAVTPSGLVAMWNDSREEAFAGTLASALSWGADSEGFVYLASLVSSVGNHVSFENFGVARSTTATPPYSFDAPVLLSDQPPEFADLDTRTRKVATAAPPRPRERPPPRKIPALVKARRRLPVGYDEAFRAVVAVLEERKLGPQFATAERGLVNTKLRDLSGAAAVQRIGDARLRGAVARSGARYFLSVWLEPRSARETDIGADALIALAERESGPLGRRLGSNGTFEREILEAITARAGRPERP